MHKLALTGALLLAYAQVGAVALGSVQGSVFIGRPFDVLLQTQVEPGQGLADLCLQPQLLYGEQPVSPASLNVTLESVRPDGRAWLRVRSSEPVNEPIVTLSLAAGCQAVFRRTYTLLPDMEPVVPLLAAATPIVPAAQVDVAAAPGVPVPQANRGADAAAALPAPNGAAGAPETPIRLTPPRPRPAEVARLRSKAPPRAPAAATAAPPAPAAVPTAPAAAAAPVPTPGARLQLDPVPLPAPAAAPMVGVGAVAGVAATPAPSLAESEVRSALEQEVAALRAEQERLRLALESAQAQLLQAQAQPAAAGTVPLPWLWGAGALAVLLLGGLWYALRSRRLVFGRAGSSAQPWWHTTQADTVAGPVAAPWPTAQPQPPAEPAPARASSALGTAAVSPAVVAVTSVASHAATEPAAAPVQPLAPAASSAAPIASDQPLPLGAVAAHSPAAAASHFDPFDAQAWDGNHPVHGLEVAEGRPSMFAEVPITPLDAVRLLEAWQQADFFESIAQPTQAMQVLAQFVNECPRASEAPYLRWLWLETQGGSAPALGPAARCYENHFLRIAPAPAALRRDEGLEHDTALLRTLQAQWPLLPVRASLEQALASQPGESQPGSLTVRTLAAFDDLLLLLALLDTLAEAASDWVDVSSLALPAVAAAPVAASMPPGPAPERDPMLIDFDLSRLDAVSASAEPSGSVAPPKPPAAG